MIFWKNELVWDQFILRTLPSHVSIHPNQNGTIAKDGLMRWGNVIFDTTAFRKMVRGGVRGQTWRATV